MPAFIRSPIIEQQKLLRAFAVKVLSSQVFAGLLARDRRSSYNPATMSGYTQSIQNLMNELARLPGIGMRSAERIAFHLLKEKPEDAMRLAEAIRDVKTRIKHCSVCYNLTESDPCSICSDPRRDQGLVCVVEQPK